MAIVSIELGFEYIWEDSWCALVFDTRPQGKPDGEWQSYIKENRFPMLDWHRAFAGGSENLSIVSHSGEMIEVHGELSDEFFAGILGDMLVSVLLRARAEGAFLPLPLTPRCIMSVEHHEGCYGWPGYKNLETKGLVFGSATDQ